MLGQGQPAADLGWPHHHFKTFRLVRSSVEVNFGLGAFNILDTIVNVDVVIDTTDILMLQKCRLLTPLPQLHPEICFKWHLMPDSENVV